MAASLRQDYQVLIEKLQEVSQLGSIMGVLHWDQEVIMPEGGADSRAKQISTLAGIHHEKSTHPVVGELLEKFSSSDISEFNDFEKTNISEAQWAYDRSVRVPEDLVKEIAELGSRGHMIWIQARKDDQFSDFAPVLEKFIKLIKKRSDYIDPEKTPYDVNIENFERGTSTDQLDPLFDNLKSELIPLIKDISNSKNKPDASFLEGNFPIKVQQELGKRISSDMGFSFDHGRMDVSVHPFCGGGDSTDVRITTRYRSDNFVESLYAVIHETGHGLYEQGRMPDAKDLPVSESLTMGIHESQSLFWERMIAQRKSFCSHYLDTFVSAFPEQLKGISTQQFYEGINLCHPSFIRVEADEVTYPLHVILRYELEKGLFDGSISVDQLPDLWNNKMEEYLGIRPPNNRMGVLQDVHWSSGSFGYFPSYTLGAMYASQFYSAMLKEIPDAESQIEKGEFANIKKWLNTNIHSKGTLFSPSELVKQVTGEPLNHKYFISYLNEKYGNIYKLNN
ncbi:MAG: carboxypeptidase M32 [Nitrospinales bacterium]